MAAGGEGTLPRAHPLSPHSSAQPDHEPDGRRPSHTIHTQGEAQERRPHASRWAVLSVSPLATRSQRGNEPSPAGAQHGERALSRRGAARAPPRT
eukprot:1694970-Prymnesium_polylepis.1